MAEQINVTLFPPNNPFGTDFYIVATIEIEHSGSAEFIPPYNRPDLYDPGCGAEWSVVGVPELFHDCGGDGEKVGIGPALAAALAEFIEEDKGLREQVEDKISDFACEDADY